MSFEVICVQVPTHRWTGNKPDAYVEVGNKYTVVDEEPYRGYLFLILAEFDSGYAFDARCFSRVSDIDEAAILEARYDAEVARLDEEYRQIVNEVEKA